jgi:hypothetical protein
MEFSFTDKCLELVRYDSESKMYLQNYINKFSKISKKVIV